MSCTVDSDGIQVSPAPTVEELAAIMAAYKALWPEPSASIAPEGSQRWRYAGRWWSKRRAYGGWS
ncbi:MAG: hypothetical protein HOH36_17395 [Acidimicrobiaceae bacterium]|nr:hypothetical protein [Acidimicrobiaceae bacterium]MBT5581322.1 hypothetical protein [Acidimicrobiaceae bacterium]MBT5852206.1 hypothetical protein [Acidimicrobiaceae bacterium]